MALTAEQQAQLDIQLAVINAQNDGQLTIINAQNSGQAEQQAKQAKLEAVRLAKETLLENARSKPVDARDVSAADITTFADALITYINS